MIKYILILTSIFSFSQEIITLEKAIEYSLENSNDQTEITLRGELFKIEKDLPPVDVMFLYDVINKIGELSDRAEQVGHRISLIASR